MIQSNIAAVQFGCNAAIAVSAFVFVVYGCDFCFGSFIFVCAVHPFQMVVEGCTGQLSDLQQDCQRKFLPQSLDHLRFLRWRRSFSKTKACKFFR